ncbi:prephenate dehydrogenase [Fragilaria crotonensis]|nr:prephenate dehydrogenase [Fragilaria crotonensis]
MATKCHAASPSSLKHLMESCGVSGGASTFSESRGSMAGTLRIAYQGEPGAYSEKATRELLGDKVVAIGRPDFESCFRAVANRECDYACLPIENSLGGSIHENYDLMLRYDLTIVAEHEFRVKHCMLAKKGVKRVEDDDTNFTRFLLLARKGVASFLKNDIPSKTSVVFTLPNTAGALYKALACFSLREIDFSKIESRPTSASLLNFLKFRSEQKGRKSRNKADTPRFRYCFYLDFLAGGLDENAENALAHLREQADFVRILGSYPQKSRLVGPVAAEVEELKNMVVDPVSLDTLPSDLEKENPLKIGFVGFGTFGQFLAQRFAASHHVSCIDRVDRSEEAKKLGVEYYQSFDTAHFLENLDVVVLAVPLVDFEDVVLSLPADRLRGKLVVEVCPLSAYPKSILLKHLGSDVDIISSHPMFGSTAHDDPYSGATWDGRPMVYEKVRISDAIRCETFLNIFGEARCQMVEMTAEQHDASTADAEFVTHLTGRLLDRDLLPATPVTSREYAALCDVADMASGDSFDLFFGMFKFNTRAKEHLNKMRENLAMVERQLASKEAYLAASAEMKNTDRQRLLAETKSLLQEILHNSGVEAKAWAEQKGANVAATEAKEAQAATESKEAKEANETRNSVKTEIAFASKSQGATPEKATPSKVPLAFTSGSVPIIESTTPTSPSQSKK